MFNRTEKLKEYLKLYPITSVYILISLVLFLIMTLDGGSTNSLTLLRYGALSGSSVLNGEYYRMFTSMFLHIGFLHLVFNMTTLYVFGAELERIVGKAKYTIIILASGVAGSLAVITFSGYSITAGASGAVFGLFGVYFYLIQKKHITDNYDKKTIQVILILNFATTFLISSISTSAHIGGFIGGYILSWFLISFRKH